MEEELEESETEALSEDYPAKREECLPMQDGSESGKGTGHAKEARAQTNNKYELDEPTVEELEATEAEEMVEDDPTVLKPPFSNESDDSSSHILVKVQDCDPPTVSWEPPHNCRENSRKSDLLLSDPRIRSSASTVVLTDRPHEY